MWADFWTFNLFTPPINWFCNNVMILTAAVAAAVSTISLALSILLWTWFHSHRMKPIINFRFLDSGFSSRAHVPLNAFIFWSIKSHRLISVHQFNCGMAHTVHQPYSLLGFVQPIRCQIYPDSLRERKRKWNESPQIDSFRMNGTNFRILKF